MNNFVLIVRDEECAIGGGMIFTQMEPGIYETHTNFLKSHRGMFAVQAARLACRWMFTHTDCMILLTRIPAFNKAAEKFCTAIGGTREFERKAVWPSNDGLADMSFWALRYDDWVRKTPELSVVGHEFHEKLDSEFFRHGVGRTNPHEDEECHDRYVGACMETIFGGQPEKAIVLYNRWARFAGYGLVSLVAHNPLILDIGDAVLQMLDGNTFKVIKCRQQLQ